MCLRVSAANSANSSAQQHLSTQIHQTSQPTTPEPLKPQSVSQPTHLRPLPTEASSHPWRSHSSIHPSRQGITPPKPSSKQSPLICQKLIKMFPMWLHQPTSNPFPSIHPPSFSQLNRVPSGKFNRAFPQFCPLRPAFRPLCYAFQSPSESAFLRCDEQVKTICQE